MNTIEVATPSGYKVKLNQELTYGQLEDIQDISTSNITIDPNTGKAEGIDYKQIKEGNKKALEYILVEIIDKDGKKFEGTIRDLPAKDGTLIMTEISKIVEKALPDQKKGV